METKQNILKTFLQAPVQSQTYLNLIYLLLAFPLGLSYFLSFCDWLFSRYSAQYFCFWVIYPGCNVCCQLGINSF